MPVWGLRRTWLLQGKNQFLGSGDDIEIMEYNLEIIEDDLEIEPLRKFILDIEVLTLHIKKHRKSRNFNKQRTQVNFT